MDNYENTRYLDTIVENDKMIIRIYQNGKLKIIEGTPEQYIEILGKMKKIEKIEKIENIKVTYEDNVSLVFNVEMEESLKCLKNEQEALKKNKSEQEKKSTQKLTEVEKKEPKKMNIDKVLKYIIRGGGISLAGILLAVGIKSCKLQEDNPYDKSGDNKTTIEYQSPSPTLNPNDEVATPKVLGFDVNSESDRAIQVNKLYNELKNNQGYEADVLVLEDVISIINGRYIFEETSKETGEKTRVSEEVAKDRIRQAPNVIAKIIDGNMDENKKEVLLSNYMANEDSKEVANSVEFFVINDYSEKDLTQKLLSIMKNLPNSAKYREQTAGVQLYISQMLLQMGAKYVDTNEVLLEDGKEYPYEFWIKTNEDESETIYRALNDEENRKLFTDGNKNYSVNDLKKIGATRYGILEELTVEYFKAISNTQGTIMLNCAEEVKTR